MSHIRKSILGKVRYALALGALCFGIAAQSAISIDTFTTSDYIKDVTAGDGASESGAAGGGIIGGQRDISANLIIDDFSENPGNGMAVGVAGGILSFDTDALSSGEGIVQWDGTPGLTLNPTGLGGTNLWIEGDAFVYEVIFLDLSQFTIRIEAYSSPTRYTRVEVVNTGTGQYLIPFADLENPALCGTSGGPILSVECGADGNVDFSNLGALQAVVNVDGGTPEVDLAMGPISVIRLNAALGDTVWEDCNGNGIQDSADCDGDGSDEPEPGIPGVTVNLLTPGGDGVCGSGDEQGAFPGATMVTGANGFYQFNNLTPGGYCVEFVKPSGYECTVANAGIDNTVDSDVIGMGDGSCQTVDAQNPIDLTAGENDPTWDAGLIRPASLGDRVWNDLTPNNVQDAGDTDFEGAVVTLLDCSDSPVTQDLFGNPILPITTGPDGAYAFVNLAPGGYKVQFMLPSGYTFVTPKDGGDDVLDSDALADGKTACIALASGEDNPNVDAGVFEVGEARLGDLVWEDLNADGIQDDINGTDGEPGIDGVVVELWNCVSGVPTTNSGRTETTNASGYYAFENLTSGEYAVRFPVDGMAALGWVTTLLNEGANDAVDSDADVSSTPDVGFSNCVTLPVGGENLDLDAGFYRPASIGDTVWLDTTANDVQDSGEPGVEGVLVTLEDCAGNPVLADVDGNPIVPALTNVNGFYSFDNLIPGDYVVRFESPTGFSFVMPMAGSDASIDSDAGAGGASQCTTLDSGENDPTVDAGLVEIAESRLGDFVWHDLDADGVQDAGETGIPNIPVELWACEAGVPSVQLLVDATNAGGFYNFTGLTAGSYAVRFDTTGWIVSPQNQPVDEADDSDADPGTGFSDCVTLGVADENLDVDTGLYRLAELGNYVWEDLNANGLQDDGDTGINGVEVALFNCGDAPTDPPLATQFTANNGSADGYYLFSGLMPGCYRVEFTAPAGFSVTTRQVDGNPDSGVNSDAAVSDDVELESAESNLTIDAGYTRDCTGSIGDYVWIDADRDGVQDASESGIANVTVILRDASGTLITTATTDGNGFYSFTGLCAGDYIVEYDAATVPAGLVPTLTGQGSISTDSNPSPTNVNLPTDNSSDDTIDFGFNEPCTGTIGNFVWNDSDRDGIQDAGESGIAGVTVILRDASGALLATETTDGNGFYSFTGLCAGDYIVEYDVATVPAGMVPSPTEAGGDPTVDSNPSPTSVNLPTDNSNDDTIDFGFNQPCDASVGDFVWLDSNENGIQDANEPGIEGVTVKLLDAGGTEIGSTTTDANGFYSFGGLCAGDYAIQVVISAGYSVSPQDQGGDDTVDSDIDSNGRTVVFSLADGQVDLSWDAGLIPSCKVCVGVRQMTLKISAAAYNRDQNETVRVRANSATGPVLFSGKVPTGGSFSIDPPLLEGVAEIYVTVQGYYHPQETVKAHFLTDCDLAVGATDGNSYITFKVTEVTQDFEVDPTGAACAGMVCGQKYEAEDGQLSGLFQVYQGSIFSGGAFVKTPNNGVYKSSLGEDFAEYRLTLSESQLVKLQVGVLGPDGNSDSFWVTIDGQPAGGYLYDTASNGLQSDFVNDRNGRDGGDPVMVSLAAGEHVIRFYLREDGTKLDWVEPVCAPVAKDPAIDIRKQAEGPDSRTFSAGATVPFEIVVTNTGDVELSDVVVSDPLVPACDNVIGAMAVGQSVSYTCETVLAAGGGTKTYRDEFNERDYDNNDGSHDFSGNWVEDDKQDWYSQNPLSGNVLVGSNNKLWLDDYPDTGTDPSAKRSADLSGATSATLSFDWETHSGVDYSDKVVVEISSDGGASYTVLHSFTGFSGAQSGSKSFDISAYISAETTVRFRVAKYYGGSNETFKVDNLTITSEGPGSAVGFNNEACASGTGAGHSVSDCDTSEVVVGDTPPTGCGECVTGIKQMTLKIVSGSSSRPADERIRVREGGLGGAVLYDSYDDGNPDPTIPTGGSFTFDIPNPGTPIVVTVQGANHPSEYVKATFATDCSVDLGDMNGNSYIQFKITEAVSVSNQPICENGGSDGHYDGYKRIYVSHSGKCLDVSGVSQNDGANVHQWDCHSGDNQQWELIPHSSGAYQLRAKHSGKCLDGYWANSQGDNLKQWSCASSGTSWISDQLFNLDKNSDGSYRITHSSGKCVDVYNSSQDNGGKIGLWSSHSGSNQRWGWN
ncbi:MAG: RICIN domain-containing protein [Gammaproteobacteria bacterium]|nr:RICIN domain-containing protein [Gammaproteobacteria bacterium]